MSEEKKQFTNKDSAKSFLQKNKPEFEVKDRVEDILAGNKIALSQTITLLESQNQAQAQKGQSILEQLPTRNTLAKIIGITGSPGVGKSSFVEQLGIHLVQQELKVAVLAIDPSSQMSKGSILGDKTRMEKLSHHPKAYIRPSAAGKTLGGVAQATKSTITLCEKAGFDVILIETVGVGQSEVLVHAMSDMMLLLLQPGAGDELQGIKKGVVELADLLIVNKNDTDKKMLAKQTKQFFSNAIHMLPSRHQDWTIKVLLASAMEKTGIEEAWINILKYFNAQSTNGQIKARRMAQSAQWFDAYIEKMILATVLKDKELSKLILEFKKEIEIGETPLFQAVETMQKEISKRIIDK